MTTVGTRVYLGTVDFIRGGLALVDLIQDMANILGYPEQMMMMQAELFQDD